MSDVDDGTWLTAAEATDAPGREAADALRLRQPRAGPPRAATGQPDQPVLRAPTSTGWPTTVGRAGDGRPEIVDRPGRDRCSTPPAGSRTAGWDATQAARDARYEEVAAWLWGTPSGPHDHWRADPDGLAVARRVQAALPADTPLPDRLRVVVAALRPGDPLRNDRRVPDRSRRAPGRCSRRWSRRSRPSTPRDAPSATGSLAHRLWTRVSPLDPTPRRVRALDRALSLLADHELATSTLAVRVAASTWADPYLLLLTGLATVGGPLHGGASEFVRQLLRDRPWPRPPKPRSAWHCATASTSPVSVMRSTKDPIPAPPCCSTRSSGPAARELWQAAPGVLERDGRARRSAPERRLRARSPRRGRAHGARRGRDGVRDRPAAQAGSRTGSRSTRTVSATASAPPTPDPRSRLRHLSALYALERRNLEGGVSSLGAAGDGGRGSRPARSRRGCGRR